MAKEEKGKENIMEDKKVFICPMHKEIQSEKFGQCPKCGMKLVEKGREKDNECCC